MLKLEFPNETHKEIWEALKQKRSNFEIAWESKNIINHETFEDFLKFVEQDINWRPWLVPASIFLFIKDNEIIGNLQIRHHIEHPNLKEMWWHIWYAIVPWQRGKWYGKEQLHLGILEAKKLWLKEVMISCLSENIASAKVIESQWWKFISEIVLDNPPPDKIHDIGKKLRRYLFTLN